MKSPLAFVKRHFWSMLCASAILLALGLMLTLSVGVGVALLVGIVFLLGWFLDDGESF